MIKNNTDQFKIILEYIKDLSIETPSVSALSFVKENISNYQLNIDITSKPLKNKLIEVNTTLKFEDKGASEKKSYYEIVYTAVVKIDNDIKEKKDLEKIILCDVPTSIYSDLEKCFLSLVHNSGHPQIKLEKKVDFQKLYNERFN